MIEEIDYEKLRLDVLERLIDDRNIDCKRNKQEYINFLKLYDKGGYIRETKHEKDGGGYLVGVDIKNHKHLVDLGKLVEKREAVCLNRYSNNRIWYRTNQTLI